MLDQKYMDKLMKDISSSAIKDEAKKGLTEALRQTIEGINKNIETKIYGPTSLNAREAVTGFVAWLTTRDTPITFSAIHGSAEPCDLVNQFCNVNNLPECRDEWTDYLTHPEN